MTHSGPLGWDPFRPIDMLASLWSSAATTMAPVSTGAAAAYQTLFTTLRRLIVGRRLTVRVGDGDITLTVTELDSQLDDVRALSVGQLDNVRIVATELEWDGNRLDRAVVLLHNVHLRPSMPPVLVAAPVDLSLELPTSTLDDLFRRAMPRLTGNIGADSVGRLRWTDHPDLGNLEVDAQLDGSTLWLKPRGLVVGRHRWPLPRRLPGYPVRLPPLPHGFRVTDVSFSPRLLHVSGTLPEWRIEVPRAGLEDIINQLSSTGRPLNPPELNRWWLRRSAEPYP